MKFLIASDIHGSAYYCSKLIERCRAENADKMILLGDLLYHGPRNDLPREYEPKRVIKMLNDSKQELLCVRGNCEAEVDQMVLEFPVMAEYMILYLDGRMIFATHGHKFNEAAMPPLKKGDILLHGHTHIPALETREDYIYINPGSISIPKGRYVGSYLILEGNSFQLKSMEGQVLDCFKLSE